MKIEHLSLRGAIGVREGIGKEQVDIDFSQLESGLVCVYGENGSGKSTFVENLTPFPWLHSRDGKLADHFFLKDSHRDLRVRIGDDHYRFFIEINAVTGKLGRFVFKNGEALNADGNEKSYLEQVVKLFGSPELYFASLFMPQDRQSFASLPPERREELFNLAPIQAKVKYAGDQAKALAESLVGLGSRKTLLQEQLDVLANIDDQLTVTRDLIVKRETSLVQLDAQMASLQTELEALDIKAKDQAVSLARIAELNRSITATEFEEKTIAVKQREALKPLESTLAREQSALAEQQKLNDPAKLARMQELGAQRAELATELEKHREKLAKYTAAATTLSEAKTAIKLYEAKQMPVMKAADTALDVARSDAALIDTVPCQSLADEAERKLCESCQFLKNAVAARESIGDKAAKASALTAEFSSGMAELAGEALKADAALSAVNYDKARHDAVKAQLAAIDAQNPQTYIEKAARVGMEIEKINGRITSLSERVGEIQVDATAKSAATKVLLHNLQSQRDTISSSIDPKLDESTKSLKAKIETLRTTERADREQLASAKTELELLTQRIEQREKISAELKETGEQIAIGESDQADWNHLSQMLGRNGGFQSYLIETSAVEMTEFANRLLAGYGVPWTIEIATSVPTADGKSEKAGFFVFVNTESGRRELGDLSGGERVRIDTILYHAVADMLKRRSGLDLRTKIMDEADGALDEEAAMAYLRALELAHEAGGFQHTLLISHRPEIQSSIPTRIHFEKGKGVTIERD